MNTPSDGISVSRLRKTAYGASIPVRPALELVRLPPPPLPVAGLTPFTSIDYPGHFAAVLFLQGCPWRCRYCHNANIQTFAGPGAPLKDWQTVADFLEERRGWLDALVLSGGEPTAHAGLERALADVRARGFKAGLHTAGIYPERLRALLPHCDWVGFDVKAPFDERYERVTGVPGSGERALQALHYLLRSGQPFQLRTTQHPRLLSDFDILELKKQLRALGAPDPVIQKFRPAGCRDAELLR